MALKLSMEASKPESPPKPPPKPAVTNKRKRSESVGSKDGSAKSETESVEQPVSKKKESSSSKDHKKKAPEKSSGGSSKDNKSGSSKDGKSGSSKDSKSGSSKDSKSGSSKDNKSGESSSKSSKSSSASKSKSGSSSKPSDKKGSSDSSGKGDSGKEGKSGLSKESKSSGSSHKKKSGDDSGKSDNKDKEPSSKKSKSSSSSSSLKSPDPSSKSAPKSADKGKNSGEDGLDTTPRYQSKRAASAAATDKISARGQHIGINTELEMQAQITSTAKAKKAGTLQAQWVQCDKCSKWRSIPGSVDMDSLPEKWFCSLNQWDALRDKCTVEEEVLEVEDAFVELDSAEIARLKKEAEAFAALNEPQYLQNGVSGRKSGDALLGPPPAVVEVNWIQCDKCDKWRKVPLSIDTETLPDSWECTMNTWNLLYAKCSAKEEEDEPELMLPLPGSGAFLGAKSGSRGRASSTASMNQGPVDPDAPIKTVVQWVQCERKNCKKWRKLPGHVDLSQLPEKWYCEMNSYNPDRASCDVEEDSDTEDTAKAGGAQTQLILANSKGPSSLSYRRIIYGTDGKVRPIYSEKNKTGHGIFSHVEPRRHNNNDKSSNDTYVEPVKRMSYWSSSMYDERGYKKQMKAIAAAAANKPIRGRFGSSASTSDDTSTQKKDSEDGKKTNKKRTKNKDDPEDSTAKKSKKHKREGEKDETASKKSVEAKKNKKAKKEKKEKRKASETKELKVKDSDAMDTTAEQTGVPGLDEIKQDIIPGSESDGTSVIKDSKVGKKSSKDKKAKKAKSSDASKVKKHEKKRKKDKKKEKVARKVAKAKLLKKKEKEAKKAAKADVQAQTSLLNFARKLGGWSPKYPLLKVKNDSKEDEKKMRKISKKMTARDFELGTNAVIRHCLDNEAVDGAHVALSIKSIRKAVGKYRFSQRVYEFCRRALDTTALRAALRRLELLGDVDITVSTSGEMFGKGLYPVPKPVKVDSIKTTSLEGVKTPVAVSN